MENRKLVFLPGGLAHGPYQVEGKGGRILECTTGFPHPALWFPGPTEAAQGSPSQASHMEGGESSQTSMGQVSWRRLAHRGQPQFVPYVQWAG